MRARRAVVVRRQRSAGDGAYAEHVEIIAADELAVHAFGLAAVIGVEEGQWSRKARQDSAEHGVAVAEVAIHRIGKRVVVELTAGERSRILEEDELIGIPYRQPA